MGVDKVKAQSTEHKPRAHLPAVLVLLKLLLAGCFIWRWNGVTVYSQAVRLHLMEDIEPCHSKGREGEQGENISFILSVRSQELGIFRPCIRMLTTIYLVLPN
ncbi:hypothetical protein BKA70DRAFT_1270948 [Coprinopsis sp. MPI-PUGE-AT-0042]|nr:hypothetical protein BKA70DRAFT_1270948 [Coprinopsis sp. MPI-PUGE-AT-0042]